MSKLYIDGSLYLVIRKIECLSVPAREIIKDGKQRLVIKKDGKWKLFEIEDQISVVQLDRTGLS